MNLHTVKIEPASEAEFAPYGKIIRRPQDSTAANLASGAVESWLLPFEAGTKPLVMFNRYHDKGRQFSVMEKHLQVTQCFFPLGGTAFIMVVGLGGDGTGDIAPENVRAFHIDGNHGVLLWRNVWHSLARFPVDADYIDLAFLTDEHTQQEIEGHLAGGPVPTQTAFIDFAKTHQTEIQVGETASL